MATLTPNYNFFLPAVNDPIDADLWGGELNTNFSNLDTLLGNAGVSPTGGISIGDDKFTIDGSSDATKKLAFEVDGITTSTTRTVTVQDVSGTMYVTGGQAVAITDGGTGQITAALGFAALKQAATTAATGVVQIATSAEIVAGTDTSKSYTPAATLAAQGFTATFISSNQAIVQNAVTTIAHGLGRRPIMLTYEFQNVTAEGGYSPGEILILPPVNPTSSNGWGFTASVDSTNIYINIYNGSMAAYVNKTNHGLAQTTSANWVYRVRAFA